MMTTSGSTRADCRLYLAPIQGVTNHAFRAAFHRGFAGVDKDVAPFVRGFSNSPQRRGLKSQIPVFDPGLPVVPQILTNSATELTAFDQELQDLGYPELNWNLGCPFRVVTLKKRGSGLLPHAETVRSILEKSLPRMRCRLSIKLRLGLESPDEILDLIPIFNAYPLHELMLHPRIGTQQYRGRVNLERFGDCLKLSRHPLVYNGDIFSLGDFEAVQARFPEVTRWMLGRGILANPFLPAQIRGLAIAEPGKLERVAQFHDAYARGLAATPAGQNNRVDRLREWWFYLHRLFAEGPAFYKRLAKFRHDQEFLDAVQRFFAARPQVLDHVQACSGDFA